MGIATAQNGLVTYTGFDPVDNGKEWVEEHGVYTYVRKQEDEWTVGHITITAYSEPYLEIAKQNRYPLPPRWVEQKIKSGETAYYFWHGLEDFWLFNKEEAIKMARDKMRGV